MGQQQKEMSQSEESKEIGNGGNDSNSDIDKIIATEEDLLFSQANASDKECD